VRARLTSFLSRDPHSNRLASVGFRAVTLADGFRYQQDPALQPRSN
jgi:hypothetical protein